MSVFVGDCVIILGHEEIEKKSNEIPAAQKLVEEIGLSDCIFTFDALHCQEKTLQVAAEIGNDVIVQVKKNLLKDCENVATTPVPDDIYTKPYRESQGGIFLVPVAYRCGKMEFGRSCH